MAKKPKHPTKGMILYPCDDCGKRDWVKKDNIKLTTLAFCDKCWPA